MHTSDLLPLLNHDQPLATQTWANDAHSRALQIARYRRYADGRWDAQMTDSMRATLRLPHDPAQPNGFGANYMRVVLTTMADRLHISQIRADNPDATAWAQTLLNANRFDALQLDVHEACLRDGDTFVMLEWDAERGQVRISPQNAWDGNAGMLVVYARSDRREVAAALRVWYETRTAYADTLRVNVYWPERVQRFAQERGGAAHLLDEADWTTRDGAPLGVPVVPFSNRARGSNSYGISELEAVIPLQDLLNRVLHSMSAASELAAFPIYVAKGFAPPAGLTPGMILSIGADGLERDQVASFEKIPGSDTGQYIEQARFIVNQIYETTNTPFPGGASANASGESLRQREVALLGKLRRFEVRAGNAWEDVLASAAAMQQAFGRTPARAASWSCEWDGADPR